MSDLTDAQIETMATNLSDLLTLADALAAAVEEPDSRPVWEPVLERIRIRNRLAREARRGEGG